MKIFITEMDVLGGYDARAVGKTREESRQLMLNYLKDLVETNGLYHYDTAEEWLEDTARTWEADFGFCDIIN